ncbi:hypothetical protein ACXYMO_08890 [Arenibacterium sp. CAU 1754]
MLAQQIVSVLSILVMLAVLFHAVRYVRAAQKTRKKTLGGKDLFIW